MKRILFIGLALLLGAAWVAADEPAGHGAPAPDDPRFEFLKKLAGTWTGTPHEEGMPESTFEFRVTAGGHAVEEREMTGTPMEMLTVYHMDGNELVATHYCLLGNQPHVKAARKVVDDSLSFACNGKPGNTGSHNDQHIHAWTMKLQGDDKLVYSAEMMENGKVAEAPSFVLTRQADTASR